METSKGNESDVITVGSDRSYSFVTDISDDPLSLANQETTSRQTNHSASIWERLVRKKSRNLDNSQSIRPFQSIAATAILTTGLEEVSPTPCNSPVSHLFDVNGLDDEDAPAEISLEPQHTFNFYQKSGDHERITEFIQLPEHINQKPR